MQAKAAIAEAVACYRVGAYRAAIVATWIAAVFDLIAKFRELATDGNGEAKNQIEKLEHIYKREDLETALRESQIFERNILTIAKDKFELLSGLECDDLQRLYEDRHRCAHPSMHTVEEPYHPSGELVRYHLGTVFTTLLTRPPVQGKAVLNRIWERIESDYFPAQVDKAIERLRHGVLDRPSQSVVRSVILGPTKKLLSSELPFNKRSQFFAALNAIITLYHEDGERILREKLPTIIGNIADAEWPYVIQYLRAIDLAWNALDKPGRDTAQRCIQQCPLEAISVITDALSIPALRGDAYQRLPAFPDETLAEELKLHPLEEYVQEAIQRWKRAISYDEAKQFTKVLLITILPFCRAEHLTTIIDAFRENNQLHEEFVTLRVFKDDVFEQARDYQEETKDAWIRLYQKFHYITFTHRDVLKREPYLKYDIGVLLDRIQTRYPDIESFVIAELQAELQKEYDRNAEVDFVVSDEIEITWD
jgi:hypothetical protein